jgi:hypothetical protein
MLGRSLLRLAANGVFWAKHAQLRRFRRNLRHSAASQQAKLLDQIINLHRETGFGSDHGFESIKTVTDYRQQVPIQTYDCLQPYVDRVQAGEYEALLTERPMLFALTSGTTAARKHIPITRAYLKDYRRGWNIWGVGGLREHPDSFMVPVLQLTGDPEEFLSECGVPCGSLSGFSAQIQTNVIKKMYAAPVGIGKIHDSSSRYYAALRFALLNPIGMLISANPSSLVGLARVLDTERNRLIRDIRDGTLDPAIQIPDSLRESMQPRMKPNPKRAKELESIADSVEHLWPCDVWPMHKLMIGCWTGGSVGPYVKQVRQMYRGASIRDIGLLASEGRMTIPFADDSASGVLDLASHFFEFIPEGEIDSPQPITLGVDEVELGQSYFILPTTKSGLYRYHIVDLVRVTGFFGEAPCIEFLGKGKRISSITGEKLSEYQVTEAMLKLQQQQNHDFGTYALAPIWDAEMPYYGLFLEEVNLRTLELATALDQELKIRNCEYACKRDSNRLGRIRVQVMPKGTWQRWDRQQVQTRGGTPEQYKHPCLITDPKFRDTVVVLHEHDPDLERKQAG